MHLQGWRQEQDLERREGMKNPQEAGGQQEPSVIPPSTHPVSQNNSYLVHFVGEASRAGGPVRHSQVRAI